MSRTYLAVVGAGCCLLLFAASAAAESQTMRGQGDLKKMVVSNGRSAVTVKLVGFRGPCQAKGFSIKVFWGTKPAYQVQANCTGNTTWTKGLYFDDDRRDGAYAEKRVRCRGFSLKYNSDEKSWRAVLPRECLSKAADRVRVDAEGINYTGSALPGVAGPTRLLRRG